MKRRQDLPADDGKPRSNGAASGEKGGGGSLIEQLFDAARRTAALGEFRLEQTSLRVGDGVSITKSSEGLGWSGIFAAITDEKPHETLHGAVAAAWLRTTFSPIAIRQTSAAEERSGFARKNRIWLIAPGESVYEEVRSSAQAMHVYLRQSILEDVAGALYPDAHGRRRMLSAFAIEDPTSRVLMGAIKSALDEPPHANALKIDSLSRALAAHLLAAHCIADAGNVGPIKAETLNMKQLSAIADYNEANLATNLSVSDLAPIVGLSSDHFRLRFKASTGFLPYQYLTMRRIQRAKRYLTDSQLDIASIALQCGFVNPANFATMFRRATNMSPGEFRRRSRN